MLCFVKSSYILAYFVDTVILHCEWLKCSGIHLFKSFYIAAVKVIYYMVYLGAVWSVVMCCELNFCKGLGTVALQEVCKFVCYEQTAVLPKSRSSTWRM